MPISVCRCTCGLIILLALAAVLCGARTDTGWKATQNAVGRVVQLEHELLDELSNSTGEAVPGAAGPSFSVSDRASFPSAHAPSLPNLRPDLTSSSASVLGSLSAAEHNPSPPGDASQLPPPPAAKRGLLLPADQQASPSVKPWVRYPRPPMDPRAAVGSSEFFAGVQAMHKLGHPVESKFPSAVVNRTLLDRNLTRAPLELVQLVRMFQSCSPSICPAFSACAATNLSEPYAICRSPAFHTLPDSVPSPKEYCVQAPAPAPSANESDKARPTPGAKVRHPFAPLLQWKDAVCLQDEEGWWGDKFSITVYNLHEVYINEKGITFDSEHVIDRNGCIRDDSKLFYEEGKTEVLRVDRALSLFYIHTMNFFHSLIEVMPLFITIAPFLQAQPDIPLLMPCAQWLNYKELGLPLVGIPVEDLNVVCIETKALIHVKKLIQPIFPPCGIASPELYFELRRRFYLPQDGLPFYQPGWALRGQNPLTLAQMERTPEDWVVVLAHRPTKDRSLSVEGELWEAMLGEFGPERAILFNGSMHILHESSWTRLKCSPPACGSVSLTLHRRSCLTEPPSMLESMEQR